MIRSDVFPIEGRPHLGSSAVVAPIDVKSMAYIAGQVCAQCGEAFEPGEIVTLVREPRGVAYIHDRDIRREEVE